MSDQRAAEEKEGAGPGAGAGAKDGAEDGDGDWDWDGAGLAKWDRIWKRSAAASMTGQNYLIAQATNLGWTPTRRRSSSVGTGSFQNRGPPADLAEGKLHPRSGRKVRKTRWKGPLPRARIQCFTNCLAHFILELARTSQPIVLADRRRKRQEPPKLPISILICLNNFPTFSAFISAA